jgi:RIO kinase 1
MLLRDVANLRGYFGRYAPELLATNYGPEIWSLYERGELHTEVALTGRYERRQGEVDLGAVMREIEDAYFDEQDRRQRMALAP